MEQLLRTPDGRKVIVTPSKDMSLYAAPHNPPNTGTAYTSGTDLYYHRARSGRGYFYTYFWSMWQGTESSYELVTEEEAKEFILQKSTQAGYVSGGVEKDNCLELWPDLFEEDA